MVEVDVSNNDPPAFFTFARVDVTREHARQRRAERDDRSNLYGNIIGGRVRASPLQSASSDMDTKEWQL